jgi:hypothetical protein
MNTLEPLFSMVLLYVVQVIFLLLSCVHQQITSSTIVLACCLAVHTKTMAQPPGIEPGSMALQTTAMTTSAKVGLRVTEALRDLSRLLGVKTDQSQ